MSTTREPNPKVSVSESRYSASPHAPPVDAGVQGGDANSIHFGESTEEPALGHHGASTILPDLKNNLRSADDVERDREPIRRGGSWTWPLVVGIGTFAVMLAASPVVVWLALASGPDPVAKPPPPPRDDLMGIPVRRGLK